MKALQKITAWIQAFPGADTLKSVSIDYTAAAPGNGGIMPGGLTELSRQTDITGSVVVTNQYNFTLYFVLAKAADDAEGSMENAQWLLDFQEWVQEQSVTGKAPAFGDDGKRESVKAQNGTLLGTDEEGTALYSMQLTIQFIKKYREESQWPT